MKPRGQPRSELRIAVEKLMVDESPDVCMRRYWTTPQKVRKLISRISNRRPFWMGFRFDWDEEVYKGRITRIK